MLDENTHLFIPHVPRTGGMYIRTAIIECVHNFTLMLNNQVISAGERGSIWFGHDTLIATLPSPIIKCMIIREPTARFISTYNHFKWAAKFHNLSVNSDLTVHDYIDFCKIHRSFESSMTFLNMNHGISLEFDIFEYFDYVFETDNIDDFMLIFQDLTGISLSSNGKVGASESVLTHSKLTLDHDYNLTTSLTDQEYKYLQTLPAYIEETELYTHFKQKCNQGTYYANNS